MDILFFLGGGIIGGEGNKGVGGNRVTEMEMKTERGSLTAFVTSVLVPELKTA